MNRFGKHLMDRTVAAGPQVLEETLVDGTRHREDGPAVILVDGTEEWYAHGQLHRGDDLPAVSKSDGTKQWYLNGTCYSAEGEGWYFGDWSAADVVARRWGRHDGRSLAEFICHREDGPAIVRADGSQVWMRENRRHRVGGPAVLGADGSQWWYLAGRLHREDGPAVTMADGTQEWWVKGLRHREDDLPAIVRADGHQEWFVKGLRHREDDPAVVPVKGNRQWWINGRNGDQFCGVNGVMPATSRREIGTCTESKTKARRTTRLKTHVYLIDHEEHGIQKIGITGNPPARLGQHGDHGFSSANPRDLVGPLPDSQVRQIETLILRHTRAIRKSSGVVEAHPTLDGKTECWSMVLLKAESIAELLERIGRLDLLDVPASFQTTAA